MALRREFWQSIARNHFAVPEGQPLSPLLQELSGLLGSPDPELRDDLAYSIIDQWVRHKDISTTDLNSLADAWLAISLAAIGRPIEKPLPLEAPPDLMIAALEAIAAPGGNAGIFQCATASGAAS